MSYPSYEGALEAAGAHVHEFERFGSYQGDWWAKVTYQGQTGWINGSYGSCSGCDAIQAEFDYYETCREHRYTYPEPTDCSACEETKADFGQRYAAFGEGYLDGIMSQKEAEKRAARNLDWDSDAKEMLAWIKEHK